MQHAGTLVGMPITHDAVPVLPRAAMPGAVAEEDSLLGLGLRESEQIRHLPHVSRAT